MRIVDGQVELQSALSTGSYDVFIAPFREGATIELAARTSFLPIAASLEEEVQAKRLYRHVMVPDKHELKHYLKAIHQSLKKRV